MAADLYLNAVEDTEDNRGRISAMRKLQFAEDGFIELTQDYVNAMDDLYEGVVDRAHVGPLSFGKAMMTGDKKEWLPDAIVYVLNLFGGEFIAHKASRALSANVTCAMNAPDRSHYRTWHRRERGPSRRRAVKNFFARNDGRIVFAVVE